MIQFAGQSLQRPEMRSHQTNEQASDTPALLYPSCHLPTTKMSEKNCHAPEFEPGETFYIYHNCNSVSAKPDQHSNKRIGQVRTLVQHTVA